MPVLWKAERQKASRRHLALQELHQNNDGWRLDAANRSSSYCSFHRCASEEADGRKRLRVLRSFACAPGEVLAAVMQQGGVGVPDGHRKSLLNLFFQFFAASAIILCLSTGEGGLFKSSTRCMPQTKRWDTTCSLAAPRKERQKRPR